MSKLSITVLTGILLSILACTSSPKATDESVRTPAAKEEDSESDRLHHQKVLNRIDRIGGKRTF